MTLAAAVRTSRPGKPRRPGLVELVGPAGAGKSTVLGALPAREPRVECGLSLWGLPRLLLAASAFALVPTILRSALGGQPLRSAEIGQMVRIGALRRAVLRAADSGRVLVIDEGPVFGLSWLRVFYPAAEGSARETWRREAARAWAGMIGTIIRLDAADAVLAKRIRARPKQHMVKKSSDAEIRGFSERFRISFDLVIAELASSRDIRVVSLRTDGPSPEAGVHAAIEELLHDR